MTINESVKLDNSMMLNYLKNSGIIKYNFKSGRENRRERRMFNRNKNKNIMKEFKGTKGEWVINTPESSNGYQNIECEVENVCTCYGEFEKTIPNAKLIASAPEMFELLNRIYDELECGAFTYEIEQLITKITE